MLDGYTIVFEIINFLILVVLLKKFLFTRIVEAMDKREASIVARVNNAKEREDQAAKKAEEYDGKLAEFEAQRSQKLEAVEDEVARQQKEMLTEAREQVEARRQEWRRELADERDHFMKQLSEKVGEQLRRALEAALKRLADADLANQVAARFCSALEAVEEDDLGPIKKRLARGDAAKLFSAFDLDVKQSKAVKAAVTELLGSEPEDTITIDTNLICGIECRVGGVTIGWSAAGWLDDLTREVESALDRQMAAPPPTTDGNSRDQKKDSRHEEGK